MESWEQGGRSTMGRFAAESDLQVLKESAERFLDSVNFPVINEIFDAIAARSGAPTSKEDPSLALTRARVLIDISTLPDTKVGDEGITETLNAAPTADHRHILLFWKLVGDPNKPVPPMALHNLIHEFTHLRSYRERQEIDVQTMAGHSSHKLDERYGFVEHHEGHGNDNPADNRDVVAFKSLNEAVTETIALEVLHDYLHRTGEDAAVLGGHNGEERYVSTAYEVERVYLEALLDGVAAQAGVARDVLWRSFVTAYVSGDTRAQQLVTYLEELSNRAVSNVLSGNTRPPAEPIHEQLREKNERIQRIVNEVNGALDPQYIHDSLHLS